jgi:hypothetical protein
LTARALIKQVDSEKYRTDLAKELKNEQDEVEKQKIINRHKIKACLEFI